MFQIHVYILAKTGMGETAARIPLAALWVLQSGPLNIKKAPHRSYLTGEHYLC